MSGTIGHVIYAVLGARLASQRRASFAALLERNWPHYLAGAYLGADIQTMPEAICVDTGRECGYGTVPLEKSPFTGGAVRPFRLSWNGHDYRPQQIHEMFYGRAHLVFGWVRGESEWRVPWDHLADYGGLVLSDSRPLGEGSLAYVCGWLAHIVGDCLIKSIQPGLELQLLDGTYTARNRPVQDLVTYHRVGKQELGLNWEQLIADMSAVPVEEIQLHYMRIGERRGKLGQVFREGWRDDQAELLREVLRENRRYFRVWSRGELEHLQLTADGNCQEELSRRAGGLTYTEMVTTAERAGFRAALQRIGTEVADLLDLAWRSGS